MSTKNVVKEKVGTTLRCGWCSNLLFHPPIKLPVTGWVYTPNELDGTQLSIKSGVATYFRVCIDCARYLTMRMDDDFLINSAWAAKQTPPRQLLRSCRAGSKWGILRRFAIWLTGFSDPRTDHAD